MLSSFSLFPSRSSQPDYLVAACTNVVYPLGTIVVLLYCILLYCTCTVLYLFCIVLVLYCTCNCTFTCTCIAFYLVAACTNVIYPLGPIIVWPLASNYNQKPAGKILHILRQKDASQEFFVLRIFTSLLEVHLYQMKPSY